MFVEFIDSNWTHLLKTSSSNEAKLCNWSKRFKETIVKAFINYAYSDLVVLLQVIIVVLFT